MGGLPSVPLLAGRWPANVLLSHAPECVETGTRTIAGPGGGADYTPTGKQGPVAVTRNVKTGAHYGTETVPAFSCSPSCPVRMLDEQSGDTGANGGGADGARRGRP